MSANALHSAVNDSWRTTGDILDRARYTLTGSCTGTIDLDPASDPSANESVGAARIITRAEDGLVAPWFGAQIGLPQCGTVFVNPPGGRDTTRGGSLPANFWKRLVLEAVERRTITAAVYLAFSVEQLALSQDARFPLQAFPFCVPRQRIRFVHPDGRPGPSPTHSSAIALIGGSEHAARFHEAFGEIGYCRMNGITL